MNEDIGKRLRKIADKLKADEVRLWPSTPEEIREMLDVLRDNVSVLSTFNRPFEKITDQSGIYVERTLPVQFINPEFVMRVSSEDVVPSRKPFSLTEPNKIDNYPGLVELANADQFEGYEGLVKGTLSAQKLPVLGAPRLYNCDDVADVVKPARRAPAIIRNRRNRLVSGDEFVRITGFSRQYLADAGYFYNARTDEYLLSSDLYDIVMDGVVAQRQQQIALGAPRAYFND